MKPPRRRVDGNQGAIVSAMRQRGASVELLAALGNGIPDLLVGYRGRIGLVECKNPDGRGEALTTAEARWRMLWGGVSVEVAIVRSPEEAVAYLERLGGER